MKKNLLKVLGLLLILMAVIIPAFLAITKAINESLFVLIFLAILVIGFLIYKIDEIGEFETKFLKLKILKKEIFAKAEEVTRLSRAVSEDKRDLRKSIRIFIETLFLTLATRNKFPIPGKVEEEIRKNLNLLASFAIKNKGEDKEWDTRMKTINVLLESNKA